MYKAIDIHAHFGNPILFPQKGLEKEFLNIDAKRLAKEYADQNIIAGCFSDMQAIFSDDASLIKKTNDAIACTAEKYEYFYFWAVINPLRPESFLNAEKLLKCEKCVGIKIHPSAGKYDIADFGDEIFSFCDNNDAVLLTHTGDIGCTAQSFVPFADKYPNAKLILAHLGYSFTGALDLQVNAVKASKSDNIYIDCSSAKSLLNNLIEWAANEIGPDKILFGTDAPLHNIAMMKQRIEYADLNQKDKEDILCMNALKLFKDKFKIEV